jgi:hypothetical protein
LLKLRTAQGRGNYVKLRTTQGRRARGASDPQIFSKDKQKVPFFVMKSALFVQANVAVNTKLTSKVICLVISMFFKKFGQKRAILV